MSLPPPRDDVKDAPAFDFFPERFWFAVEGWPDADVLRYFRLLSQQWMRDGLPADPRELSGLARGKVSDRVLAKFPVGADGKRRNAFLESIRSKQRQRIAKRREGAAKTTDKRWGSDPPTESLGESLSDTESDSLSDPVSDDSATRSRLATTHHSPPTTESPPSSGSLAPAREAGPTTPEGKIAAEIVALYPGNGNRYAAAASVVAHLRAGDDPAAIRARVAAHAAAWRALPPKERRYCPGLATYFAEARWNDDPAGHPWTLDASGPSPIDTTKHSWE